MTDRLEPSLREVVARMRDPRGVVLKKFFLLSLVASVASAIAFTYAPSHIWEAAATAVLTLAATALSAALIEISVRIREVWERTNLIRQFTALFGCTDERTDESAALVMACFPTYNWRPPTGKLPQSDPIVESADSKAIVPTRWQAFSLKHLADIDGLGTTMADMEVAINLIAAFSHVGLPPPRIIWDIDAIDEAKRPNSRVSTFISVGLSSNIFSVWAAREHGKRFVRIDSADGFGVASRYEQTTNEWAEIKERLGGSLKYGLITRFAISEGRSAMIVGGVSAEASKLLAPFLAKRWQSLVVAHDNQTHEIVGGSQFVTVLEVRAGHVEISDVRVPVIAISK